MTITYRALIVDDERLSRVRLRQLLKHHETIKVVAEADSVTSAVGVLSSSEVDVIFLDIQMPGGDGFSLFERCNTKARVIFVTAHEGYALRAFEVNALDYLVKPIEPQRLAHAIVRLSRERAAPSEAPLVRSDRVCLVVSSGMRFVSVDDILYLSGADDYSEVHLADGSPSLSRDRLSAWEARLNPAGFFRIHRSTLINLGYVEELRRQGNGLWVHLKGQQSPLSISRRRVAELRRLLHTQPDL